jgi:hypothetical protein
LWPNTSAASGGSMPSINAIAHLGADPVKLLRALVLRI